MPELTTCKRCERNFIPQDLYDDGLCNACHSGYISQAIVDLAIELRELPQEADLFSWARRIAKAFRAQSGNSQ